MYINISKYILLFLLRDILNILVDMFIFRVIYWVPPHKLAHNQRLRTFKIAHKQVIARGVPSSAPLLQWCCALSRLLRSLCWLYPPHLGSGFSRTPRAHYSTLTKNTKTCGNEYIYKVHIYININEKYILIYVYIYIYI